MKRLKILIICLICILLTGCINTRKGERNVFLANTVQNQLNYKQNIFSEQGKVCAFYNGRVYYFVNDDRPGIYSMQSDGKKSRMEVSVESIRKIQVTDEGIYYAAPYNKEGKYTIFYKAWDRESEEYFSEENLQNLEHDLNVWDFYVDGDGLMTIIEVYARIPQMFLSFSAFMVDVNRQIIPLKDYKDYLVDFNDSKGRDKICISGYDDILFTTETDFNYRVKYMEDKFFINLDERNMTVFNRETNEMLLMRNESVYFDVYFDGIIQTIYEDKFIISSGNQLYWVLPGSSVPSHVVELPDIREIKLSVQSGGKLFVAGVSEKEEEYIYEINLEKAEAQNVSAIEPGQKVIAIDNGYLYTITHKAAYVYKMKNGSCKQTDEVKWEKNLRKSSKIEMAGNTIFVYNIRNEWKNAGEFVLQESHVLKQE